MASRRRRIYQSSWAVLISECHEFRLQWLPIFYSLIRFKQLSRSDMRVYSLWKVSEPFRHSMKCHDSKISFAKREICTCLSQISAFALQPMGDRPLRSQTPHNANANRATCFIHYEIVNCTEDVVLGLKACPLSS